MLYVGFGIFFCFNVVIFFIFYFFYGRYEIVKGLFMVVVYDFLIDCRVGFEFQGEKYFNQGLF